MIELSRILERLSTRRRASRWPPYSLTPLSYEVIELARQAAVLVGDAKTAAEQSAHYFELLNGSMNDMSQLLTEFRQIPSRVSIARYLAVIVSLLLFAGTCIFLGAEVLANPDISAAGNIGSISVSLDIPASKRALSLNGFTYLYTDYSTDDKKLTVLNLLFPVAWAGEPFEVDLAGSAVIRSLQVDTPSSVTASHCPVDNERGFQTIMRCQQVKGRIPPASNRTRILNNFCLNAALKQTNVNPVPTPTAQVDAIGVSLIGRFDLTASYNWGRQGTRLPTSSPTVDQIESSDRRDSIGPLIPCGTLEVSRGWEVSGSLPADATQLEPGAFLIGGIDTPDLRIVSERRNMGEVANVLLAGGGVSASLGIGLIPIAQSDLRNRRKYRRKTSKTRP